MIQLMKNEIIKLLKKRSFYVVTFVFILFCILTNVVYQTPLEVVEKDVSITELEEENQDLDLEDSKDLLVYVDNLTIIKMEELKSKYSSSTDEYLIEHFLYSTIYHMYESMYVLGDQALFEDYSNLLDERIKKVEDGDWQYFLEERIAYLEEREGETEGIEKLRYQKLLELANYRKENNIAYDSNNYLHNSLVFLEENMVEYINLLNDDNLTIEEESRLTFLKEEMSIHEYVIDHQQDLLNENNLRAVLMNFPSEFGLFILIYVIMLAGSIVSEEYSRGTIKYLLTKPFKRSAILTSKLLVVILFIPLIMLFMSVIEIVIGGIILGFDSLLIPVVLYISDSFQVYSVISYLFFLLASVLPMYLVIGILAFMISTVTKSTSAAITISFLFYLLANVISNLALIYDFPLFKVFVSLYWDFSYLVHLDSQPYGATVFSSSLVIFVYLLIMLCISYVTFAKNDVKNL